MHTRTRSVGTKLCLFLSASIKCVLLILIVYKAKRIKIKNREKVPTVPNNSACYKSNVAVVNLVRHWLNETEE